MKKYLTVFLTLCLCLSALPALAQTELTVFAAASMTEALTEIAGMYQKVQPDVQLTFNFDSSGTLKTQIEQGAEADVFISAGQKQMNELDCVLEGSRFDLLTNTVVLIVPEDSAADVVSFEDVGTDKVGLIALGNSDVPVGQYAQDVFTYLKLWDKLNGEHKITFASNVKEVLSQVEMGAVDCGVVYISDAVTSQKIRVVASAPEGSHQPVCYPAAALAGTKHEKEALAFLEYLKGDECKAVFEKIGFGAVQR
ncbi:MAG: molybdate ABC transporter substrate-binding protein [Clostridia bacterium]|nr:molybdate ABC transporter substrate-binding protein [Clostridia bacterium]